MLHGFLPEASHLPSVFPVLSLSAEKLAGSEAALENVKGSVEFKTEEEARAALLQAEDSKKQAEEVYQKVLAEAKKAANAQKQAETLISRYQQEIPEQKKCFTDFYQKLRICRQFFQFCLCLLFPVFQSIAHFRYARLLCYRGNTSVQTFLELSYTGNISIFSCIVF